VVKLKIGYLPYSRDLTHPADRRRLLHWAKKRGHEIVLDLERSHDVLFLSGRSDLTKWSRQKVRTPIILDLVDGYLGDEVLWRDWLRGSGKVAMRQNSGPPREFRKIVSEACSLSQAVACETIEQKATILPFCSNTHTILDFHEEFPMRSFDQAALDDSKPLLMWEGLPYTAKGLIELEDSLIEISKNRFISLEMVTNLKYPKFFGRFYIRDTEKIVNTLSRNLGDRLTLREWDLDTVIEVAKRSHIAVLPLDPKAKLNPLKAENRLLMMWRVGLPVLASPSLAYKRVMKAIDFEGICLNPVDWENKILELVDSKVLRQELVERGQQYIRETHSEEILLKAWDELFESVI
jgi:glycosyltransferase involved in cell wall biosynthesis